MKHGPTICAANEVFHGVSFYDANGNRISAGYKSGGKIRKIRCQFIFMLLAPPAHDSLLALEDSSRKSGVSSSLCCSHRLLTIVSWHGKTPPTTARPRWRDHLSCPESRQQPGRRLLRRRKIRCQFIFMLLAPPAHDSLLAGRLMKDLGTSVPSIQDVITKTRLRRPRRSSHPTPLNPYAPPNGLKEITQNSQSLSRNKNVPFSPLTSLISVGNPEENVESAAGDMVTFLIVDRWAPFAQTGNDRDTARISWR